MVHLRHSKLFYRSDVAAGAKPGTIAQRPDANPTQIKLIRFNKEAIETRDAAPGEDIRGLVDPEHVLWIDIRGLADTERIKAISESFGLSALAIADLLNVGQRPKYEDLDSMLLVLTRMVTMDEERHLVWEQLSVIVGDGYVITFQETYDDCFGPIRDRLHKEGSQMRRSPSDVLAVMLLDAIVDGYFPVIESFGEQLEGIETEVLGQPRQALLADIYRIKRELTLFRRAAWPMRDAISKTLALESSVFTDRSLPVLKDIRDHIVQVADVLESYRELSSSLVDVYLSSVSNRMNEVMRVLTIFSTIFIPLGFLAGVYGMNFDTSEPSNLPELSLKYGYILFWCVAVALVIGLLGMFWRFGWLSSGDRRDV